MSEVSLSVVDGDLIAFKASAACETRTIDVSFNGVFFGNFPNRTKFKAYLKETVGSPPFEEFTITDKQEVEDLANCLHTIKVMLQGIQYKCKTKEQRVCVQGEGNFRDDLLLPTKYKGGRTDMIKPLYLKQAKEYLLSRFKAEQAHGKETDDVCAAYAYEGYVKKQYIVQCSTDKDSNSNVGWLFNWDKMEAPEKIEGLGHLSRNDKGAVSGKGRKWFVHQCLFGDRSDSYIPYQLSGMKFGEKASFDLLKDLTTDKECWQVMYDQYKIWYPNDFTYEAWNGEIVNGNALQQMQLYIDCAHMRRFAGDRVVAQDVLTKLGVQY